MMSAHLHVRDCGPVVDVRDFRHGIQFTTVHVEDAKREGTVDLFFASPDAVKAFATEILAQVQRIESSAPELLATV